MEDQSTRASNEGNAGQQPAAEGHTVNPETAIPPLPSPGVIDTGHSEVHEAEGNSSGQQPAQQRSADPPVVVNILPQPNQPDKTMNRLTAIIALATVINVGVFWLESESTAKDIDKLTRKAGEIVGAMNTALDNSRKDIKAAFDQNKAAVDASTKEARKALDASTVRVNNNETHGMKV